MPKFIVDETGEMVTDYFYEVHGVFSYWDKPEEYTPEWISSSHGDLEGDYAYAKSAGVESVKVKECSRDPTHTSRKIRTSISIDLFGGPVGPIIPEMDYLLISGDTNRQLQQSGLRKPATIHARIRENQTPYDDVEVYALTFPGRSLTRRCRFEPSDANKCPFCGWGPLLCMECEEKHYGAAGCPRCGKYPTTTSGGYIDSDPRLLLGPTPKLGTVLDASLWDGSDFCGHTATEVMTRRAVDFLLSIHAAPFLARPLRVFVGSCTKEQREKLEEAKRPVN